jgi:hypothetical protein
MDSNRKPEERIFLMTGSRQPVTGHQHWTSNSNSANPYELQIFISPYSFAEIKM